ncbi:putative Ig domain-containing protein [Rhizobium sp. MHM7A]|uniref:putative Ig domain-containing protein n=1 Tax=Rhizobium sp. MHM7A TaxID=2583233 RepID=UPI001485DAC9|nr:putative Ig domain-containing protein [Rhizobium sp. MHM7A]
MQAADDQFYFRSSNTGILTSGNTGSENPDPEDPTPTIALPDIADQSQVVLGKAGTPISSWVPQAASGWPSAVVDKDTRAAWTASGTTFSANYDLSQYGLSFNQSTGAITGTPNKPFILNDFAITVTASGNSDTTTPFRIAAMPAQPLAVASTQKTTYSVRAGTAFSTDPISVENAIGDLTFSKPSGIADYGWDTATGALIWTSSTLGTDNFTTTITDEFNRSISWAFSVTYEPVLSVSTLLPVSLTGTRSYDGSTTIRKPTATGLVGSPFWFAGDVPTGLAYDVATGVIAGSVTDSAFQGQHNIPLMVFDDADGSQASGTLTLNIEPPFSALAFAGATLKQGTTMTPVSFNIREAGTNVAYNNHNLSWTMVSGSIPPGIATTVNGELFTFSGKPTAQGSFTSIWKATDANGWSLTLNPITFTVEPRDPLTLSPIADTSAVGNKTYTEASPLVTATATNVSGTPTWSAEGLPSGLSINPTTGSVTGTVTNGALQGDHIVTIKITDNGDGTTISTSFKLTLTAPFSSWAYTGATLKQQVAMTASGFNLRESGSNLPYKDKGVTATLLSGSLPTGINAAISGEFLLFSGVPTVSGTFFSTWKVTDGNGWSLTLPAIMFKVDPRAALAVTVPASGNAKGEVVYTEATPVKKATSTGVIGTATYSATGLPTGLTIGATTGSIIGSVTDSSFQGNHNVTVSVVDSNDNATASVTTVLTVTSTMSNNSSYTGATLTKDTAMTVGGFNIRTAANGPYRNKSLAVSLISGSTPPGITFAPASSTSELLNFSGTPTATGTYTSLWKVTDVNGWTLTLPSVTFVVNP